MFSISTKYGISSTIKNEALGLWYDAKTKVAQNMNDLKSQL